MKYSGQNSIRGLIELIKNKFDTKLDSTANAVSASKIEKPVTLSFTGGVAGSASFDGSTDIDISLDVVGALDENALNDAINTALARAKASGEFDGEDGYTPVRGTDYWTAADIAEIKSYVDDAILGGAW